MITGQLSQVLDSARVQSLRIFQVVGFPEIQVVTVAVVLELRVEVQSQFQAVLVVRGGTSGCGSVAGVVAAGRLGTSKLVVKRTGSFMRGSYQLSGKMSSSDDAISFSSSAVAETCLTDRFGVIG